MRWSRSVCVETQWFQLRPGLILIYFSDIHCVMHRVIFVKIELGGQKIVKKIEDPFSFFSPKLNKILQLPSKISEDLFRFFFFFNPNSKEWSQGGQEIVKKSVDPFSSLVLNQAKFFNSPQNFWGHFYFIYFLVPIRKNGPRGVELLWKLCWPQTHI